MSYVPSASNTQPVRPPKPSYMSAACGQTSAVVPAPVPKRRAGPAIMVPEGAGFDGDVERALESYRRRVARAARSQMLIEQQQQHVADAEVRASLADGANLLTGLSSIDLRDPLDPLSSLFK